MMGPAHVDVSVMKHALCCVEGLQSMVSIGEADYDISVTEVEHPVIDMLRSISRAQRTFAREYLVFGRMRPPTTLHAGRITVDEWPFIQQPILHTLEVPLVFHSVWECAAGRTGYVLANWTGVVQDTVLELAPEPARGPSHSGGIVELVSADGRVAVPSAEVREGRVRVAVPPRSVLLVEQSEKD
jgi:hypothetical protein